MAWDSPEDLIAQVIQRAKSFLGEDGEGSEEPIEASTPLLEIGMDSMSLAQYRGMLQADYGLTMTDEEMFDEGRFVVSVDFCYSSLELPAVMMVLRH